MTPGARNKFEPEVFGKQMYCMEESICEIIGTFGVPRSHSAPQ